MSSKGVVRVEHDIVSNALQVVCFLVVIDKTRKKSLIFYHSISAVRYTEGTDAIWPRYGRVSWVRYQRQRQVHGLRIPLHVMKLSS